MSRVRKMYSTPLTERANALLDAWLAGMVQAGHEVTGEAIGEVWLASVAQARREGLSERYREHLTQ